MKDTSIHPPLSEEEKEALDRKMELLRPRMSKAKKQYEDLVSQYAELLDRRHPERREEQLKEILFQAYRRSDKSLEEVLAYMSGEDEDDF